MPETDSARAPAVGEIRPRGGTTTSGGGLCPPR